MPNKPKRPCSYRNCPNLCYGQFCDEHKIQERRKYDKYKRNANVNKIYGGKWKAIRKNYVPSHPFCERCLADGKLTKVDEVHHILPTSKGGTHSISNLISLCKSCHNKIHIELGDRK